MMNMNELSNLLIHYGRKITDLSFKEECANEVYHVRIRTFAYNGKIFWHQMVNGDVTECFELK